MSRMIIQTDEQGRRFVPDHYIYITDPITLSAGDSGTRTINIEADADFIWLKTSYFATIGGGAQTDSTRVIPLVRAGVTDSGSGRNLQNTPVPLNAFAGHDGLPFNLSQPRVFAARSSINVMLNNFSDATEYEAIQLAFIGYKKFYL